ASAVAAERARRGELAELVADVVLGDVHLDELPAVVDEEGLADELGHHGAVARPGLERLAVAAALLLLDPRHQALVHVGAFFQRPAHSLFPSPRSTEGLFYKPARFRPGNFALFFRVVRSRLAAADDRRVGRLAFLTGLTALG